MELKSVGAADTKGLFTKKKKRFDMKNLWGMTGKNNQCQKEVPETTNKHLCLMLLQVYKRFPKGGLLLANISAKCPEFGVGGEVGGLCGRGRIMISISPVNHFKVERAACGLNIK